MGYKLGRALQFVGLLLLPVGIAGDVAGKIEFKESLLISCTGMALFAAGWVIQNFAKRS